MEKGRRALLLIAVFSNLAWATVLLAFLAGPLAPRRPEARCLSERRSKLIETNAGPALRYPGKQGKERSPPIPKILHHVHIGKRLPQENLPYIQSCRLHYSERAGWSYMFWNETAAKRLIKRVDPGFYKMYTSYRRPVHKADAIRPYIMKHLGGLYLDSDTECWREGSDMLEGYDVVLQGHHPGEALANGMMASVPNHPFWNLVIDMMKQRRAQAEAPDLFGVLSTTGPLLLRDAVLQYFGLPAIGPHDLVRIPEGHPRAERFILRQLGSWFIPCVFLDKRCNADMLLKRAVGRAPLEELVGMHHYSIGWWKQPGGKLEGTAELEFQKQVCNMSLAKS